MEEFRKYIVACRLILLIGTCAPITRSGAQQPPIAKFKASDSIGCNTPYTISFTDQSLNSPTSWQWSFGDGATSTLQNPTHIYSAVGTRIVQLTATNSQGNSATSVFSVPQDFQTHTSLTIYALPTATISGSTTICSGNTAHIVFTGTPNATVVCMLNGTMIPGIVLNGAGSYTLSTTTGGTYSLVEVIDAHGCFQMVSGSATVTVNYPPMVDPMSGNTLVCSDSTTQLTDNATGATSTLWSSSNNNIASVDQSGLVTCNNAGSVTITYSATNGCGTVSSSSVVQVNQSPGPISGTSSLCQGTTGAVIVGVPNGNWVSLHTNIATLNTSGISASVIPANAGLDTIVYTLGNGCQTRWPITVFPTPSPTVTPGGTVTVCNGSTVTLNASTGVGLSYQWYNGANLLAGQTNPTYVASGAGSYNVLETEILYPCSAYSSNAIVSVISGYNTSASAAICQGQTYMFGGSQLTTGGSYIHTFISLSGCDSTVTLLLTINPSPIANLALLPGSCGRPDTLAASGGVNYYWLPLTGLSCNNCSSPAVISGAPAVYTVTATVGNGCLATATISTGQNIAGHVTFSGPAPAVPDSKVWLLQQNPLTNTVNAIDSVFTCMVDNTPYYRFNNVANGTYTVLARLLNGGNQGGGSYVPTYAEQSAYWNTATYINTVAGADTLHVSMQYGAASPGPAYIGGNITSGANKNTNGSPVTGMLVYLQDAATNKVLTYTYTDNNGNYSFHGIAYGSYIIFPEDINYATTASYTIVVAAGHDSVTQVDFKQHTSSMTITPGSQRVINTMSGSAVNIYPNPVQSILHIDAPAKVNIILSTVSGSIIRRASGIAELDMTDMPIGMYLLAVYDNQGIMMKMIKLIKSE